MAFIDHTYEMRFYMHDMGGSYDLIACYNCIIASDAICCLQNISYDFLLRFHTYEAPSFNFLPLFLRQKFHFFSLVGFMQSEVKM